MSEAFLTDIEHWLHRDVDRGAPEESIPRLLAELHSRTGAPLNRSRVAIDLGYHSRQSFDLRLVKLVRTFGGIWCPQVTDKGRRLGGAMAKLYLTDPVMAWLGPRLRAGLPEPDMTKLTESTIAVALAATVESRQPGRWATDEAIGYYRGRGKEVDFAPLAIPSPAGDLLSTPIEVKWVSHGWRPEAHAIENSFGGGVVVTKNITDTTHPSWAMPAPLVALLLS